MTVLVTGARGQLGRALAAAFGRTHRVVATTRDDLDITDPSAVRTVVGRARPALVVNCAAYNDVDGAEQAPETALAVNAFGVETLAAAVTDVEATLLHYSTDFVFDGTASTPYDERAEPGPLSVYAISKLLGEWFAQETPRHYVVRVESLFGGPDAPDGTGRRGSLDLMAQALLTGRPVPAFTDRVVSPSYVEDVVEATLALVASGLPAGLYHCVGSGHATWFEVAQELARRLDVTATVVPTTRAALDRPARRPVFCALSNRKLADAGIVMPPWEDAVRRFAERLRAPAAPASSPR